jgi:hypothetical protein
MRGLGLRPWMPLAGRLDHPWLLPRADVIHGPNFAAPAHPRARTAITIHDLAFRNFPEQYPAGVAEELDCAVRDAVRRGAWILCDSDATLADVRERYHPSEERCRRVYQGIDDAYSVGFPPISERGWPA